VKVEVHNRCSDFNSYRAARVKSLFNAESGCNFDLVAELPEFSEEGWNIGLIVGPSGTGKSSLGQRLVDVTPLAEWWRPKWPADVPIVDAIDPDGEFNDVTAALAAVGLGDVPAWLRPYSVLSTGEKFRADLARLAAETPPAVVVDEFTSVVDRQIAKIGALAFSKAWRRTTGRAVLLSCHYDIAEWLTPDWVFDTGTGQLARERLQRPRFQLEVRDGGWQLWPLFEPHHYLKAARMPFSRCYVGFVDGEPVCHMAVSGKTVGKGGKREARACRLVVMPEWQGAGVGLRFLNFVCQFYLDGKGALGFEGKRTTSLFHTSHPGLVSALRRDPKWRQVSARLYGGQDPNGAMRRNFKGGQRVGRFGGHFRAVQGFRYVGEAT
jgi:energy-coupling factor transporter ATP-binding protein EcfA2